MVFESPRQDLTEQKLPQMVEPDWNAIKNPEPSKIQGTWIGHASFLIQMDGLNIVTDPVFSDRCSPVQFAGPKRIRPVPFLEKDLPDIDIVIISHNHYDHLDLNTVMNLKNKVKRWYVPLKVAQWFKDQGIENVVELDWWDEHEFTSENSAHAKVVCTPCQHFSGRTLWDRSKTLWASWVVIGSNHKIYFAGDTGYKSVPEEATSEAGLETCPVFKEIGSAYGPFDLACIPIGAYCPRPFMSRVHLNPEDAVAVHLDVRSKQSVAMHWGTFILTSEPVIEPIQRLVVEIEKKGLSSDSFISLKHGETRIFGLDKSSGEKKQ